MESSKLIKWLILPLILELAPLNKDSHSCAEKLSKKIISINSFISSKTQKNFEYLNYIKYNLKNKMFLKNIQIVLENK